MKSPGINIGDVVVATRNGGHDARGLPAQRPVKGQTYRITDIYEMRYGLGCELEGLDPRPYNGYFLYVESRVRGPKRGWYFKREEDQCHEPDA